MLNHEDHYYIHNFLSHAVVLKKSIDILEKYQTEYKETFAKRKILQLRKLNYEKFK